MSGELPSGQSRPTSQFSLSSRDGPGLDRLAGSGDDPGLALLAASRGEEAIAWYEDALARSPGLAPAHYNLGNALVALQRPAEAIAHYERAIALSPTYTAAYNNLAIALDSLGRYDDAVKRFQDAMTRDPDNAEARNNLGAVLNGRGRPGEAVAHFEAAIALRPDYAEAHFNYGNALVALKRLEEAMARYDSALAIRPSYVEAHYNRGNVLKLLDRNAEAVASYDQAIALRPDYLEAYNNAGNGLMALHQYDDAVRRYEKALTLDPNCLEAHNNIGTSLQALGRHNEAMAHYEATLRLNPDYAHAHTNIGNALMEAGRLAEARQAFERAVELSPRTARFYRNLSDSKRFSTHDPHLAAMQSLAEDIASLSAEEQIDLHFALGKALADAGQHEASFRHLIAGNALKRGTVSYNEPAVLEFLSGLPLVFTREVMRAARPARGNPSDVPIFIVGMPRSGTTLIEQILASHPKVFGGGELNAFSDLMVSLPGLDAALTAAAGCTTDNPLHELGTRYLEHVRSLAPSAERITDKMPVNFRLLGVIHLALPNARIIHARRHPVDTCVSCFARQFTGDQPFSYDLGELGRYYRAYHTLMAHWRSVLPPNVFLEVDYERVVEDLEGQARRLIAHCGLEWDPACLEFHRTERLVQTASATQVRQPIYRSSVGRWHAYGKMLRPLLDALGPALASGTPPESPMAQDPQPDAAQARAFDAAASLHRENKLDAAAEAYAAILAREPTHFGALHRLGLLRAQQGRLEEGARLIGEALRENGRSAEAHNDLGRVLFALRRYDRALAEYEATAALRPDSAEARANCGAALQALNRPQEAIPHYAAALAIRPAAHLHNNLGNALVSVNRLTEAVAHYDQALALNQDFAEAHSNRGVALQALSRFDEAVAAHRRALALRPGYFDAHYNLGLALWAMDRHEEALACHQAAVALNPSSVEAHRSLEKLLVELGRTGRTAGG